MAECESAEVLCFVLAAFVVGGDGSSGEGGDVGCGMGWRCCRGGGRTGGAVTLMEVGWHFGIAVVG